MAKASRRDKKCQIISMSLHNNVITWGGLPAIKLLRKVPRPFIRMVSDLSQDKEKPCLGILTVFPLDSKPAFIFRRL